MIWFPRVHNGSRLCESDKLDPNFHFTCLEERRFVLAYCGTLIPRGAAEQYEGSGDGDPLS